MTIADAGHFLQVEQPAAVNRLVAEFVTGPSPGGGMIGA